MSVFGAANRYMFVDGKGVLRYRDNAQEEVALFGVNYYPPFAIDYAALKQRGIDHKEAIRQDLAHFQRLGLTALRLHCFEREFTDQDGNFRRQSELFRITLRHYPRNDRGPQVMGLHGKLS